MKSSRGFTNDQMPWCCEQSNTSDEEANIEQDEAGDFWKLNCNPERKGISDSDIKEWNIELRENDLTLEEQNVTKREISIKRRSLEETRNNKKAKEDLNFKEIEIEKELRTLTEKKQDIQTNKLNEPIILKMSIDFKENIEISYKVYEQFETSKERSKVQNTKIKTCLMSDREIRLNEDEKTGLGETFLFFEYLSLKREFFRDCPRAHGAVWSCPT